MAVDPDFANNDYLSKPLDEEVLEAALARWVTGARVTRRTAGSAPDLRAVDREVIVALRDLAGEGGPDVTGELIDTYLQEAPELLRAMRGALEQGEVEALRRAAHGLKSSSAYLGAMRLSQICLMLEALSTEQTLLQHCRKPLGRALAEFNRVRNALEYIRLHGLDA